MAVAHDEATMELLKTRLSHSERPLIRLMRTFYKLATTPTRGSDEGRVEMLHMSFLLELGQLVKALKELKGTRALLQHRAESQLLTLETARLEQRALDEKIKISHLENSLQQARNDRKNKILYEEIGKEVRRFSDRLQSADRINGLAREIESLLEEQGFYAERWASRRAQFDTVISNLEVLQESIKEEKADADRKKALNDDESEDGNIGEEVGGGSHQEMTKGRSMTGGLNPQATSFVPPTTMTESGQDSQRNNPEVVRVDERIMKIDGEPLANSSSTLDNGSSELTPKPEHLPMDIDGFEPPSDIIQETTMEDGEEIEEAEEGQEMEDLP